VSAPESEGPPPSSQKKKKKTKAVPEVVKRVPLGSLPKMPRWKNLPPFVLPEGMQVSQGLDLREESVDEDSPVDLSMVPELVNQVRFVSPGADFCFAYAFSRSVSTVTERRRSAFQFGDWRKPIRTRPRRQSNAPSV
jgi:hypothetical protein